MATRAEEERIRQEQGAQFLKQLNDMFQQTRQDMAQQYVPRTEMEHVESAIERVANAVEKLTANTSTFHENAPRVFADRAETKADMGDLRTEIEKLKTARETDMQRGYGYRIEDIQGRFKGDIGVERGWRQQAQERGAAVSTWMVYVLIALVTISANIILAMALRGH